jgi:hypothetical protein
VSDSGHIIGGPVDPDYDGAVLTADLALGDTVLHVDDTGDFDEDAVERGAVLLIGVDLDDEGVPDPATGAEAAYSTCDDEAGTVTLAAASTVTASSGDRVYIQDPVSGRAVGTLEVLVAIDGADQTGDPLPAYVDVALLESVGDIDLTDLAVDLAEDEDGLLYVKGFPGLAQRQGRVRFWQDYATATGNVDTTIKLTYRPIPDTAVKVSGPGPGLHRDEWDFTDPWTIVVPAQGFHAGDVFEAHYAYTDPTTRPVVPATLTLVGYTTATSTPSGTIALPAGTLAGDLLTIVAADYLPGSAPSTSDARITTQHSQVNSTGIGSSPTGSGVLAAYGIADGSGSAVDLHMSGDAAAILAVFRWTGAISSSWIALRDAVADGNSYPVPLPAGAEMGIALLPGICGTVTANFAADSSGDWIGVAFAQGASLSKAQVYVGYTTGPHDGLFGGLSNPSIWSALAIGIEEG